MCLSNLKQLGLGPVMYAEQNRQWLPDANGVAVYGWPQREPTWARVIAKTMGLKYRTDQVGNAGSPLFAPEQQDGTPWFDKKTNGIFQCPTEHGQFRNKNGGDNATSYAHNGGDASSVTNSRGTFSGRGLGISDAYFNDTLEVRRNRGRPIRDIEILKPSNTFVLGETAQLATDPNWVEGATNIWFKFQYEGTTWHNSAGNYLWADAHATTMKPEDLKVEHFSRDD